MSAYDDLILASFAIVLAIFAWLAAFSVIVAGTRHDAAGGKMSRHLSVATVLATGVWGMQFVALLGRNLPHALAYDPKQTLLSYFSMLLGAALAVGANQCGQGLLFRLAAATIFTSAAAAMFCFGVGSLGWGGALHFDPSWLALALLVALLAGFAGVWMLYALSHREPFSPRARLIAGCVLGLAVGAGYFSALAAVKQPISDDSALIVLSSLLGTGPLLEMAIAAILFSTLMLMFAGLEQERFRLWNSLMMVGIAELVIMLLLPILLPSDAPVMVDSLLDVLLLMLLLSPLAWRLQKAGYHLYSSRLQAEKNLVVQNVIIDLLKMSMHDRDLDEILDQALATICEIPWLKDSSAGAVFIHDADAGNLSLVAQHKLPPQLAADCARVAFRESLCGRDSVPMAVQFHEPNDPGRLRPPETLGDYAHYVVPLQVDQKLQGILCLCLLAGHRYDQSEARMLETMAASLSGLINSKRNFDHLLLANTVFEHNLNCLMITDADNKILNVNPMFCSVTGYRADQVIGRDPALLQSGRHNDGFYKRLWAVLHETGNWQGEIWNKRKDGSIYPAWLAITIVSDAKGRLQNYIGAFADISENKHAEERIRQLAYYDSLTGLANRSLFYDRLEQAILHAKRSGNKLALLFIDLDRFKEVNDTLGHEAGDTLLKTVAIRIRSCLRESDVLARLGGDEFVVLLKDLPAMPENSCLTVCKKISDNIIRRLSEGHDFERYTFYGGGSIGIAIYPDSGTSIGDLVQRADTAMYEAKNAGRNTYRFFNPELGQKLETRLAISHALRHAIERDELSLVYQPLVDMSDQSIIGAEVLLRWRSVELGQVSPVEFIPLAEESGLIVSIGEWVIQNACKQLLQWQVKKQFRLHYLAINVSIHQLKHRNFADRILTLCSQFNIDPRYLELEITEGGLAQYPGEIVEILNQLQQNGFRLAIDDFGTDYSSLGRLKSFNVDLLKIDRSFVDDMTRNPDDAAIVKAIIDLGNALGLKTLAEGVETIEQFYLLQRLGCARGQGYLFGKPMPAAEFEQLMLTD